MAADLRNALFAALAAQQLQPGPARRRPRVQMPPPGVSPDLPPANYAQPAPAVARPTTGIPWGGQYFDSPAALVAWMNARGAGTSVDQFLGNHPGVAAGYRQRRPMPARPLPPLHRALLRESARTALPY